METFLSVYYAYQLEKLYIPSISFLPSTHCNLNCEACLNFTPYLKHPMVRGWEEVKKDVDSFFECVDYIMLFHRCQHLDLDSQFDAMINFLFSTQFFQNIIISNIEAYTSSCIWIAGFP